jgi:SAM-dependent methyltransferase
MSYKEHQYAELRNSRDSIFSYGLSRRLRMVSELFRTYCRETRNLQVVDFGCADGAMLIHLLKTFDGQIEKALGIDVFDHGIPDSVDARLTYQTVHLFREFPYPIDNDSQHLMIGSAFFKHNPSPLPFLSECHRGLRPGGYLMLLDPRPLVIQFGILVGYFDRKYNPNPWNQGSLHGLLTKSGLSKAIKVVHYGRYWLAPTRRLYELGFENWIPGGVTNALGLHQAAVLQKIE